LRVVSIARLTRLSGAVTDWKRARGVVIKAVVDKTEPWLSVWPTFSLCALWVEKKHTRKTHRYRINPSVNAVFEAISDQL